MLLSVTISDDIDFDNLENHIDELCLDMTDPVTILSTNSLGKLLFYTPIQEIEAEYKLFF